jgi:hypothetical protein
MANRYTSEYANDNPAFAGKPSTMRTYTAIK